MDFSGKTAVVTGGGSGIGKAIAAKLASRGASVAICGRREPPLVASVEGIHVEGHEALYQCCDVADWEQVDAFISHVEDRFGSVHILVNNAGMGGANDAGPKGRTTWREILSVNLNGSYFCSTRVLQSMPDHGRIINFSSVLGRFGVPGYTAYCTAKHGIIGFTRALALEVASRKITVNAVSPGWVETEMARHGMEAGASSMGTTYEEFRSQALGQVPLQEIIAPEEVAELVSFLASPAARSITGQTYNICGGQVMS